MIIKLEFLFENNEYSNSIISLFYSSISISKLAMRHTRRDTDIFAHMNQYEQSHKCRLAFIIALNSISSDRKCISLCTHFNHLIVLYFGLVTTRYLIFSRRSCDFSARSCHFVLLLLHSMQTLGIKSPSMAYLVILNKSDNTRENSE